MNPIVLADGRLPPVALERLSEYAEVIRVSSENIVYPAISGHPDIFFCQTSQGLVYAPNASERVVRALGQKGIQLRQGNKPLGNTYPLTAMYNAVVTPKFLIHNPDHTDNVLGQAAGTCEKIAVKQAYTRCNVIPLGGNRFITSDRGIEQALIKKGLEVFYVNPDGIRLPGFKHGFLGGTCGVYGRRVFFTGSLEHFPDEKRLRLYLKEEEVIELYDGPLIDAGSLLFIS
jgi:hypothetical protein